MLRDMSEEIAAMGQVWANGTLGQGDSNKNGKLYGFEKPKSMYVSHDYYCYDYASSAI